MFVRIHTESDFLIQDPFGLRRAITPVFVRDLHDGMFEGCGTSFYVTPFGRQLSAMHITTDFFNDRGIFIRSGPTKILIQPDDDWIGILHDPGLRFAAGCDVAVPEVKREEFASGVGSNTPR
jgi:hypothetical protein